MTKKKALTNVEVKTPIPKGKAVAKKTEKREMAPIAERQSSPFTMMRRFAEDMENMFGGFMSETAFPEFSLFETDPFFERTEIFNDFTPPVEMLEKDGKLIVRTDLPGLEKDDIEVEILDRRLTIKGERKNEFEEEKEGFFRTERSYGNFFRQVALPASVKTEDATAIFKNGVLEVSLTAPKGVTSKKKLEITEGEVKPKAMASGGTK